MYVSDPSTSPSDGGPNTTIGSRRGKSSVEKKERRSSFCYFFIIDQFFDSSNFHSDAFFFLFLIDQVSFWLQLRVFVAIAAIAASIDFIGTIKTTQNRGEAETQ